MRFFSLMVAVLLILSGGGCVYMFVSSGGIVTQLESLMILAAFGLLPFLGGILLWRYAWKDRKGGRAP